MAFTNPCDGCERNTGNCEHYVSCNRYRYWLNYNWKCARIVARRQKRQSQGDNKWAYQHPHMAKKYIDDGVCGECSLRGNCDEPCAAYWEWWDARMEYFRKVF